MDRERLVKAMRKKGVREGLVARCEDMLRETRSRVRVGILGVNFGWEGEIQVPPESGYVQFPDSRSGRGNEKRTIRRGEVGDGKDLHISLCGRCGIDSGRERRDEMYDRKVRKVFGKERKGKERIGTECEKVEGNEV